MHTTSDLLLVMPNSAYALISVKIVPDGMYQSLGHGGHWVPRCGEDMLTRPGGESAEGSSGTRIWRSRCRIIEVSVKNGTISQIQTEDFGPAQTVYLLLVNLCLPLVPFEANCSLAVLV